LTTSKAKAIGSAAERKVAAMLKGIRVGQDGGPVDVRLIGYADLQVKNLKTLPSLREIDSMIDAIPEGLLRGVVVIERAGYGRRGTRTITFDLDEWAEWHGGS